MDMGSVRRITYQRSLQNEAEKAASRTASFFLFFVKLKENLKE